MFKTTSGQEYRREMWQLFQNIITLTDSYKVCHWKVYPPHMTHLCSYFEAREGGEYKEIVFFGLQYILKKYLAGKVVTKKWIDDAEKEWTEHFNDPTVFNRKGWEHILKKHKGRLPIEIKAVPEGTVVPEGNVLFTVESTDPACAWITNYIEPLLVQVWHPSDTATISREMGKIIWEALVRSGTATPENFAFKLHGFSFRAATSVESAAIGCAGHLVIFKGTDTYPAIELIRRCYHLRMAANSINALEHSVVNAWMKKKELEAYRYALDQFPDGLFAAVSDSYDIRYAVEHIWGGVLRDRVLARNGVLVIRPDSGDMKTLIPELLEIIGKKFGFYVNEKGYKVINDKVRLIWGDGINRHNIAGIIDAILESGWSLDCVNFGCGNGLIECTRDMQRMALKACFAIVDGEPRDVFKDPVTDPTKKSKRGQLMLIQEEENGKLVFKTVQKNSVNCEGKDFLVPVFRDGELLVDQKLADIRARAAVC